MDKTLKKRASYIVKVSGNCNLGCPYCYYFKDKPRITKSIIKPEVLLKFFTEASQLSEQIEIIWHGGEPLVAGINTFKHAVEIQKEINKSTGITFRNLLQTNGTLLSQEWVDFFVEETFGIGVSLDGPQHLHDKYRVSLSNKSTFENTMQGINLLKKNGVPISILAVVTKNSLRYAKEAYNFFVTDLNIQSFDFLPMVELAVNSSKKTVNDKTKTFFPDSLDQGNFYDFMKDIFDLWWLDNRPDISIRFLDNVLLGLLGNSPTSCTFNGSCGQYTTLDVNGSVSPCDNFIEYKNLVFGDINVNNLNAILDSPKRLNYINQVSHTHPKCSECKFLKACGGGCSKYNYFLNQNFSDENYFCGDRWSIFNYVEQRLFQNHPQAKHLLGLGKNNGKSINTKSNIPGSNILSRLYNTYSVNGMQNSYSWDKGGEGGPWDRWSDWDKHSFPG